MVEHVLVDAVKSEDEDVYIAELAIKLTMSVMSDSEDENAIENKLKDISRQRQEHQRRQHYVMESGTVKSDLREWILEESKRMEPKDLDLQIENVEMDIEPENIIDMGSDYEIEVIPDDTIKKKLDLKKIMRQRKKRSTVQQVGDWKEVELPKSPEKKEDVPVTLEDLEERDWEEEERVGMEFMRNLLKENQEEQDKRMVWDYKSEDEVEEENIKENVSEEEIESDKEVEMQLNKNIIESDNESDHQDTPLEILTNVAPTLQLTNQEPTQSINFFPTFTQTQVTQPRLTEDIIDTNELNSDDEREIIKSALNKSTSTKDTLSQWAGVKSPKKVIDKEEVNRYIEKEAQMSEDELGFGEEDNEMNTDDELEEYHDDLKMDLQNNENTSKGKSRVKKLHRKQTFDTDKQQTVDLLKDLTAGTLGMTRDQRLALKDKGYSMDQENVDYELIELEQNRKSRKRRKKNNNPTTTPLSHYGYLYLYSI